MSDLPHPKKLTEIQSLIDTEITSHNKEMYSDRYATEIEVYKILSKFGFGTKPLVQLAFEEPDSFRLNAYSIHRANNQANEACNKLWATVEFVHVISPTIWRRTYVPLGENFSGEFTLGTIIPTLYYAYLSASVSILSAFGCVSLRDFEQQKDYNLVRTTSNWKLFVRNTYIQDILGGKPAKSWHLQVQELMYGLSRQIADFPQNIDWDTANKLRKARNQTHYAILGDVSAKPIRGLDSFFEFLPFVMNTIFTAIEILSSICKPHSHLVYYRKRFINLHTNLPKLYAAYKREYPQNELYDIKILQ